MPHSRTTLALLTALLAAPAALAADTPVPAPPAASAEAPVPAPAPEGAAASAAAHPNRHHPPHRPACQTKAEQRAAVASHQAISQAAAIRSLRSHGKRAEVVRARLCRRGERVVYVLTLLGRSGKVIRVSVDAVSGDLMAGR